MINDGTGGIITSFPARVGIILMATHLFPRPALETLRHKSEISTIAPENLIEEFSLLLSPPLLCELGHRQI